MSLCLNMIVKDESHIIEETLENICENFPITYWVISDTGSSDDTMKIIRAFFKKKAIKGKIHKEPWKNFSHNRNAALNACKGKGDYVLIFDADDSVKGNLRLPELNHDAYYFQMSNEGESLKYFRKLIIKNDGQFKWRGVVHEFLTSEQEKTREYIKGDYTVISGRKGNRSKNENKYREDAEILKEAFESGEDQDLLPRYAFYCAQSYRDAEMIDEAIEWYQKRVDLEEGWQDERYCSFQQLGSLFEKKEDHKEAFHYWQQGIILDPARAECWYHTARRHSWSGHAELAYCFAKQASQLDIPKGNRLFVHKNVYQYWSFYEWCLNAYKIGKTAESYHAFKLLLFHGTEDLLKRLLPQVKDYRKLVENDTPDNKKALSINLNRLNGLEAFYKALNT